MRRDGEGARSAGGAIPSSVQPADPAPAAYAAVADDLRVIFGPPRKRPEGERLGRARVVTPLEGLAPKRRRRLSPLAAAAFAGLVGGGLMVWTLLPHRVEGSGAGEGLRAMIAMAPLREGQGSSVPPETPVQATSPPLSPAPQRRPGRSAYTTNQGAPPFDARDEVPGQASGAASSQGAPGAAHDGGAALSALSQTPEVFYAGPSNAGERLGPAEGCGEPEGRCSASGAAVAADRRVRQAYAEAAAAGVSEDVLTGLRRNWSDIHDRYSERPGDLVTEYVRLADALVRARDRARAREQAGEAAAEPPRPTPDR